jgi:hypothetical protein
MGRVRKKNLHPIALSPSALADSIGVDRAVISLAIKMGELVVFQRGLARRILTADAIAWVRNWKAAPLPSKRGPYRRRVGGPVGSQRDAANPYSRVGWDIVRQAALVSFDPKRAAQIAASVGARIGQTTPPE